MSKHIYLILIILVFGLTAQSQTLSAYIKAGDKEFEKRNYFSALHQYKKAIEKNARIESLQYKYAESCRLSRDYKEAARWYKKVYANKSGKFPLSRYWYADMMKYQGKYSKATKAYKRFYKNNKKETELKTYLLIAKHQAEVCDSLSVSIDEDNDVVIRHYDTLINSDYGDFSPFEVDSGLLYYTSYRQFGKKTDKVFRSRIIKSIQKDNVYFSSVLDTLFYDNNYHYSLSPGRTPKEVFLSKCPIKASETKCEIFVAKLDDGKISNVSKLKGGINLSGYDSRHPFFTVFDRQGFMLFSSDRPNGFGKMDIWYCLMSDSLTFDNCQNAGDKINSLTDDVTPFYYAADTTLYFSSKWHDSFGGFDIFKSVGDFKEWAKPVNMGLPINSSYDDLYYSFNHETRNAWFVSNRSGSLSWNGKTCCNDIYGYKMTVSRNDSIREQRKIEEHQKHLEELGDKLELLTPLELYFDNDLPNPRSLDTVTTANIDTLLLNYLARRNDYYSFYLGGVDSAKLAYENLNIVSFFKEVENSRKNLNRFTIILEELLKSGKKIQLNLQSYSSPLNTVTYNDKLAKRRVSSLLNYLKAYNDSVFIPYIKSGKLIINYTVFGEQKASHNISDNITDKRNSVYSPDASRERRISIQAVEIE